MAHHLGQTDLAGAVLPALRLGQPAPREHHGRHHGPRRLHGQRRGERQRRGQQPARLGRLKGVEEEEKEEEAPKERGDQSPNPGGLPDAPILESSLFSSLQYCHTLLPRKPDAEDPSTLPPRRVSAVGNDPREEAHQEVCSGNIVFTSLPSAGGNTPVFLCF